MCFEFTLSSLLNWLHENIFLILEIVSLLFSGFALGLGLRPFMKKIQTKKAKNTIAHILIENAIMDQEEGSKIPGRSGHHCLADPLIEQIDKALEDEVPAILFEIKSPGGSPVAAAEIVDKIWRIRQEEIKNTPEYIYAKPKQQKALLEAWEKKQKPLLVAYIRNLGASAAYLIASGCEVILAHPSAIVGSIGVISQRFGFQQVLDKLGVEARTQTAGNFKNMLDPFAPEAPEARAHFQEILDQEHQIFIDYVLKGRAEAFKKAFPRPEDYQRFVSKNELFSGKFWIGQQALKLGLVDGVCDLEGAKRQIETHFKKSMKFKNYSEKPRRGLGISLNLNAPWAPLQSRFFSLMFPQRFVEGKHLRNADIKNPLNPYED